MRVGRASLWLVAGGVVLVLVGCGRGSTAKQITLAEFGGKLNLKLNLNKGEKFTFEAVDHISSRSPKTSRDFTMTTTDEAEVVDCTGENTEICFVLRDADVESKDEDVLRTRRQSFEKKMGVRVNATFGRLGGFLNVKVGSTDPEIQTELAQNFSSNPGMLGIVYPRDGIAIGGKWSATIDYSSMISPFHGLLDAKSASRVPINYVLVGAEEADRRKLAVIRYSAEAVIGRSLTAVGSQTAQFPTSLSVKLTGTARVNIATGMLYCDESTTSYSVDLRSGKATVTSTGKVKMTAGR
jgi:hypothetical protein